MQVIVLVMLGGAFGALCRYGVAKLVEMVFPSFPLATLIVNLLGCFLAGFLLSQLAHRQLWSFLLVVGFLGALTTFSSFSLEVIDLLRQRRFFAALMFWSTCSILGILSCWLGIALSHSAARIGFKT